MNQLQIQNSSGNVFADLGRQDADAMSLKAGLAVQIVRAMLVRAMRERNLTQRQTAELVGLKQPDLSDIARTRIWTGFRSNDCQAC